MISLSLRAYFSILKNSPANTHKYTESNGDLTCPGIFVFSLAVKQGADT